jgi:pyridoxine 5-phosphate synthase
MAINLSVNLNKVCLLRNSRGAANPSPRVAAEACLDAGAVGITLHWRVDERHTRRDDVVELHRLCVARGAEFNLEGDGRRALVDLAIELRVTQCTLVPAKPGELTSDHGWDLPREHDVIAGDLARLKAAGVRTAIFMDCEPAAMAAAARTGVDRVELYTEPYASAFGTPREAAELARVRDTARAAVAAGLAVNAGHDLNLLNTPALAREVPEILEASIGHALIADALYLGYPEAVRRYVAVCAGRSVDAPRTQ